MPSAKGKSRSGSPGKSKQPKRITEGRKHKSKHARLQCKECGGWFESLGQINRHYSAVGHKRTRKPPKGIKFSKNISTEQFEKALAMIELLENPREFRKKLREVLERKSARRYRREW